MKSIKILNLFTAIFLLASLLACKSDKKDIPGNSVSEGAEVEVLPEDIVEIRDDQAVLADIRTGVIELRSISGLLKANGTVIAPPQNLATVCAPMGGFVKNTTLLPGNSVDKGQVLVTLENNEFVDIQQNYLEAKSRLEYAEAEFKRHTELYKDDVYSQKNLQQVTAEYKGLKTEVKALEQKLELIGIDPEKLKDESISSSVNILSPIAGFVNMVNVNIGKYVTPADVMFEIVNSDKLLLELTLFEKDAGKVSAGQKIRFNINNESEEHEAVIYQTGRSVNSDKTYTVFAIVSGICKNVLPGMYVNAIIESSSEQVPVLPSEAIVSFDDKDYIFIFDRNKEENGKPFAEYRLIEVHKGVTDKGFTEVVLPEGFEIDKAIVVVKGAYNLMAAKKNAGEMSCG